MMILKLLIAFLATASPLLDYCEERPPPRWERVETREGAGYRFHVLDLHSHSWRLGEVDAPDWHHWVTIVEPERITSDRALLLIEGGNRDDPRPLRPAAEWVELANQSGSIVVELRNVPNQPLTFYDEFDPRYQETGCKEDALVAFGWDRYLETGDPTWLARLPMTLSVVSAMDAIQEAAPQLLGKPINGFVVSGKSKRGWTAWAAASVDERVVGVSPMVIDLLNLRRSMEHHFRSYGSWSYALKDYVDRKIPERWESPEMDALLGIVEPFAFRERVRAPKLIINSTGDEFFLPDSSRLYFHDLVGEKYLRYLPNVSHNLKGSQAHQSLALFHKALVEGRPLPQFRWHLRGETLIVDTETPPLEVRVWSAHNAKGRDFRLSTIGPSWDSQILSLSDSGRYRVHLPKPEEGWSAYLVELKFDNGEEEPHIFTTDVFVVPETLPYHFEDIAK
ncbi:MAG: PhoPQ-activated pathogenicity-related family protein [Parachlamydiales bacterium]